MAYQGNLVKEVVITATDKKQATKELENAVKAHYGKIILRGPVAADVSTWVRNEGTFDALSNAGIILGAFLFTPALIAGVVGKILNYEFKKYRIESVADSEVVIVRKDNK